MNSWRIIGVVLLAITFLACDANTSPGGAVSTERASAGVTDATAATSLQPSSEPPAVSQDEIRLAAAAAYLAAVNPYNKTLARLNKKYENKTSLKARREFCAKLADNARTWLEALQAITYPDDTQGDARRLIRFVAAAEANLRSCAKAKSFARWAETIGLAEKASDRAHEAANLVRLDLGLPSVPE
jgi:hypothetical protein